MFNLEKKDMGPYGPSTTPSCPCLSLDLFSLPSGVLKALTFTLRFPEHSDSYLLFLKQWIIRLAAGEPRLYL